MRSAIPVAKRLAIFLDWPGSGGSPHQTLARTYDVIKAAVCNMIYEVQFVQKICANYACFPGNNFVHVMNELTCLYHLPEKAAMDGAL